MFADFNCANKISTNLVPKCLWTHTSLSRSKKEIVTPWHRQVWPVSSGVEHSADNAGVGGSKPPLATKFWAGSDNGSTGALQAFSRGSIPRRSTKFGSVA